MPARGPAAPSPPGAPPARRVATATSGPAANGAGGRRRRCAVLGRAGCGTVGVWRGPARRTWTATSWPSSSLPVSARPGLRAGDVLRGSPRRRDGAGSVRSAPRSRNGFRSPHAVRREPQTRRLRGAVAASRDTLGAARGYGAELSWSWDALWEQSRRLLLRREKRWGRAVLSVSLGRAAGESGFPAPLYSYPPLTASPLLWQRCPRPCSSWRCSSCCCSCTAGTPRAASSSARAASSRAPGSA